MSDERQMILQMVADGKVTPDEAEKLLQAIEETEQSARSAATEDVFRQSGPGRHGPGHFGGSGHHGGPGNHAGYGRNGAGGFVSDLGGTIERAVSDALRSLDDSMRHLELSLDRRLNEQARRDLRHKIEDRLRQSTERAVEQAQAAQDRAERAAERATRRAAEHADRAARRMDERLAWRSEHRGETIVRAGISIDRETTDQRQQLAIPAEPGDLLSLDNRVGNVNVTFYDGGVIEAEVLKTVWGGDRADAEARAAATKVELVRRGSTVDVDITRPNIVGVGFLIAKDTRIDFDLRVPFGTHLRLHSRIGDLSIVSGPQVGSYELSTKVGNIDVTVPETAGFRYEVAATIGSITVQGDTGGGLGPSRTGRVGDGSGFIEANVKTGDVRIHNG